MAKKSDLFARLSLDYMDHPKIVALSDAAVVAHITLILHARKYQTDGLIRNRVANRVASQWDTDVLTELQTNDPDEPSLSKLENGDYLIHGYAEMQETRAEIEARRRRNAENGRLGGRPSKRTKTHSVTDSVSKSGTHSGTQKKAETETETETDRTTPSEVADATSRPEVEELLDYLDARIEANGAKVPNRTKKNRDAARLLLDKDERTVQQIKAAIDYATNDEFWRTNILSMSKLREKYDTLRMRAAGQRPSQPAPKRDGRGNQQWMY